MDGTGEQEKENLPTSDTAPHGPAAAGEICERIGSMQIEDPPACDNTGKESDCMTPNDYMKKVEQLETVVSNKQSVIEDLTQKYNGAKMKLLQLEKANQQATKEKATAASSSSHHPGDDVCVSSPGADTNLLVEIQNRDNQIAELKGYTREYYSLAMKLGEEKIELSRQLNHSTSLNKKLKLQADDLVEEKDRLYGKLSDTQSSLEAVRKERNALKEMHFTDSSSPVSEPGASIEQLKTQIHELKTKNEKLKQENDQSKQHIKEQEEKIEKLTLRCGRVEEDLKKIDVNKDRRHHQPTDENNDWRFRSLDEKDAKISELSAMIEHQRNKIHQLQDLTADDSFLIKEQLKAFQDDYHAEREEKERILQTKHQLQEKNDELMKQLYARQYSTDPTHFGSQMPTHGHAHSRQYTPTQTRHANHELPYHNPNSPTPTTHLPAPDYGNTIPPQGRSGGHHEQNTSHQHPHPLPSYYRHDVGRGSSHPENVNRGPSRDPH